MTVWLVWTHDYHDEPYGVQGVYGMEHDANDAVERLTVEHREREAETSFRDSPLRAIRSLWEDCIVDEIIRAINEIYDDDDYNRFDHGYWDQEQLKWIDSGPPPPPYHGYSGYEIVTDKQRIFFGISNTQECCEHWGYLSTVDDAEDYIGARLVAITRTNTKLFTEKVTLTEGFDEYEAIFINFFTDRGVFQLTAYNQHNGYYGHSVTMRSEQLAFEEGV